MDRYLKFVSSGAGRGLAKRLGLPTPVRLRRYHAEEPEVRGPVLCGALPGARAMDTVIETIGETGADVLKEAGSSGDRLGAIVVDATGVTDSAGLADVYEFLHPVVRRLGSCGRIVLVGTSGSEDPRVAAAQGALTGFVRSLAKEVVRGSTASLLLVEEGAEAAIGSTLGFLLSARSAYVSGQVVRVSALGRPSSAAEAERRVAVVTGAARGIGAEIARALARDGARVVCLDMPSQGDALATVAADLSGGGGEAYQLDITAEDAPARLAGFLRDRHGGVDVVVHNAGVLRDRTLARMSRTEWDLVLDVNLTAQERLDAALLSANSSGGPGGRPPEQGGASAFRPNGRIVTIASVSGIAGNRGQTNYAASKAGIIGRVEALAPVVAQQGLTINAVAPGFIETAMTRSMPMLPRELGRRINSLGQGGLPIDVAETVAWLADPASYAVNGNVVRVCGQSLLGA